MGENINLTAKDGVTIGAYAGKFNAERLLQALSVHGFTNISAAATHYRMMRNSGAAPKHRYALQKLSFTGEPIDSETAAFAEATFGRASGPSIDVAPLHQG